MTCAGFMRNNREPCARTAGHRGEHRSAAALENARLANLRRRDRVVLGPCRCQGCGEMVTWNGYAWRDELGKHRCAA